jgi:hypothetical protein
VWLYPPDLVAGLELTGLAPSPDAPPAVTREAVDDRYRDELRALRARHVAGEFDRPRYLELIIELRRKFWVLTLPLRAWETIVTEQEPR